MNPSAVRRLLHASSALVLFLFFFGSPELLRNGLMGCAAGAVILDSLRVTRPAFGAFFTGLVPVFRTSESTRLSGATWLCIGYALAAWFPHPAVTAGILTGALADPAASWAGTTFSKPSTKKTWIGSGAAALAAALVLLTIGFPLIVVGGGAVVAMALERWPGPLNDNLVVAPGVALFAWFLL
jgi:dolichol kinase